MIHLSPLGQFSWTFFHVEQVIRSFAGQAHMHAYCTAHRTAHTVHTLAGSTRRVTIRMICTMHKVVRTGFLTR